MTTALDIITSAARRIGALPSGEAMDATEAAEALTLLNDMMHRWISEGIDYQHVPFTATSDTVTLPDEEIGHLKALFAIELCPDYEAAPHPVLIEQAARSKASLQARYFKDEAAGFDPAFNAMAHRGPLE